MDGGGDVVGIFSDAGEAGGTPGVLPWKAEEVESGDLGDAAVGLGEAAHVEDGEFDEFKIRFEADAPNDRGDAVVGEMECGGLVFWGPDRGVVRLRWCGNAALGDVVVDALADAIVGAVCAVELGRDVLAEGEFLEIDGLDEPVELHASEGKVAEVDVVAAIAPGEVVVGAVDGFVLVGVLGDGGLVVAHFLEPCDGVLATVAAWRAWGISETEVDMAAVEVEVFHDLDAGLAGADDESGARRNL